MPSEKRFTCFVIPDLIRNGDFADDIFGAFQRKYPGVKTEYIHEPPGRFMDRVLIEQECGKNDADIMLLSSQMMEVLKVRGLIDPYQSPENATFPERAKDPDGYRTQLLGAMRGFGVKRPVVLPL